MSDRRKQAPEPWMSCNSSPAASRRLNSSITPGCPAAGGGERHALAVCQRGRIEEQCVCICILAGDQIISKRTALDNTRTSSVKGSCLKAFLLDNIADIHVIGVSRKVMHFVQGMYAYAG